MNESHLIILNRQSPIANRQSDGWIHIVPKGELPNREAGIVQVLDDPALDSILAGIDADRQRLGNKWPGVYAGREHFIYNDEADSAALAWFKDFEKRDDGIWAKADGLTPAGKQVVANSEYKFTSFVADRKDTAKVDGNRVRILKIDTIGFTNQANGKELLTPITNRQTNLATPNVFGAAANQHTNQKPMKNIATKLGLAAEASEDAILAEVTKLQNRNLELEPLAVENTTLKNRITQFDAEQVDSLLAERKITDEKIVNRLKPVLAGLKNREERVAFLADCFPPATAPAAATGRVLNRGAGKTATPSTDAASVTPQQLNTEVRKLMNRDGIKDFTVGYNALRAERPELFAQP